jgi:glucose/arabinose dehydrogenase
MGVPVASSTVPGATPTGEVPGRDVPSRSAPLGTWPPPALKLTEVATANQPTAVSYAPGDPTRLYVLEKSGRIRVIKDGVMLPEPALDISAKVLEGDPSAANGAAERVGQGKRGAVGLAFHPNFAQNGRLFLMYAADQGIPGYGTVNHDNINDDGDVTFEEYARSSDNPDLFKPEPTATILQIDKGTCSSCYQHNGGALEIRSDGFMYATTGDPPPYTDPGAHDLNSLLGKVLRFDISGEIVTPAGNYPNANPWVWDIGIRNAYKFSFDRLTGTMYVADVGEESWEEVSIEVLGDAHKDFGWPQREGTHRYQADSCGAANCVEPIAEHGHDNSDNSVIGGYVYRGARIPALQGTYLYGDNGSGILRGLQVDGGRLVHAATPLAGINIYASCFGEDVAGELYVCGYSESKIFRIDAL